MVAQSDRDMEKSPAENTGATDPARQLQPQGGETTGQFQDDGAEFIPELDQVDPLPFETALENVNEPPRVNVKIYGGNDLSFKFGQAFYATEKDRLNGDTIPVSKSIPNGLVPNMDLKFNMTGNIGNEVNMDVNFDQKELLTNNQILITVTPEEKKSFLKKLDIGNLDFDFGKSKLVLYNRDSYKALGMNASFEAGDFKLNAIGAISESVRETEIFEGRRKHRAVYIDEYRYQARKYYQLEPFLYYDAMTSRPAGLVAANYLRGDAQALNVFTSKNDIISAPPVNLDPGSVDIYIDSGDSKTNVENDAAPRYANGNYVGNYYRLREGKDFNVFYRTGRISFNRGLMPMSRVIARYTRAGGQASGSDPSSRVVDGKIETFIKYGPSMNEDALKNGVAGFTGFDDVEIIPDGLVNLDVYEVRGVYDLAATDIDQGGFSLELYSPGYKNIPSIASLGYYKTDYRNGILEFGTREPFKKITNQGAYFLGDQNAARIYSEVQPSNVYEDSTVKLKAEFTATQRTYQLKRFNIVPSSEKVLFNGVAVDRSKYYIDYQGGYFMFNDPNDPLVNDLSRIEIHYSYIPFGQTRQSFLVGSRLEYQPLKEFRAGAAGYYNGDFHPQAMEYVGHEPRGLFVTEADVNVDIDENSMTKMVNKLFQSQYENVPVKFTSFGEYAHSFYNQNSMGIALVDNMESSQESLDINLNAGDWGLSSPPLSAGVNQCNRAPLYYAYYYNPRHFEYGLLPYTSQPTAQPPYESLAGPYNLSYGHLSPEQLARQNNPLAAQQKSLALDFNFALAPDNTAPFVGIQNKVNSTVTDFSVFTQVEFYAKLDNTSGADSGVALYLDIGSVNEDADGDNKLSSEDTGLDNINGDTNGDHIQNNGEAWDTGEGNRKLDFDRYSGRSEDVGYPFRPPTCSAISTRTGAGPDIAGYPATVGNGILNTEDLNGNGQLDTQDNVIRIDPANPALQFESGSNVLLPGNWQHFKVYINPDMLTEKEKSLFRNVESIRVYALPVGASRLGRGKVYIDQIRFAGSQWKRKKEKLVAGVETDLANPSVLRVTNIDNFNTKAEYDGESFIRKKREEYEKLYGKKSNDEFFTIKEGSLKLDYNLTAAHEYAYVEKIFPDPMDISFYRKINIWVNHRRYSSPGAVMFFRIGNDKLNYLEFDRPIGQTDWQRYELQVSNPVSRQGNPDLKNARYIAIGIRNSFPEAVRNGISWVDDIYVSDTIVKSDYAYTYGAGIAIDKPLFVTKDGVKVFDDIRSDYTRLFRNYDFQSIGQAGPAFLEDRQNFNIRSRVLPWWVAAYSVDDYKSDTSHLYNVTENYRQGMFTHSQHRIQNDLFGNEEFTPHITLALAYSVDKTGGEGKNVNEDLFTKNSLDRIYQPDIRVNHKIPTLLKIVDIRYEIKASGVFYDRQANEKIVSTTPGGAGILEKKTLEKEQRQLSSESVQVSIASLRLQVMHNHSQALLLQKNIPDNVVSTPVYGDFYIPFFGQAKDSRLRQRNNGLYIETGYDNLWKFSPKLSFETKYNEDSFRDNLERLNVDSFQRLKNSHTLTALSLTLPLVWRGAPSTSAQNGRGDNGPAGDIKDDLTSDLKSRQSNDKFTDFENNVQNDTSGNITLGFRRELRLQEFSVPFTKESSLEKDLLGIGRVFPRLGPGTFDVFKYPPWYFFSSPPQTGISFYNGRQYVNSEKLDLSPDYATGYASWYDNSLQLVEVASLNSHWPVNSALTITTDSKLSQDVFRNAIDAAIVQEGDFANNVQFYVNLMQVLNFGFWKNKSNNSNMILGLSHDTRMYIVANIEENIFKPELTLQWKWLSAPDNTLSGISFHTGVGLHSFTKRQYLTGLGIDPALQGQTFIIESLYSLQGLINYSFTIEWFTEMGGLRKALESFIHAKIEHNPRYSITAGVDINRHKVYYLNRITNDLIDEYSLKNSLDINVHQNVTGILDLFMVYDVHRHPDDNHVIQEIFAIQAGVSVKILF